MSENLLINITPQETRVALILQGAVQELHIERTLSRGMAGNVYLGKVVRVLPGMQSAFIDIGLERAAFLHVADIWEARGHDGHGGTPIPIERLLFDGQSITVQVVKDPIGTKGARLSTQISIAGRMLVYLPQDSHIGISQRIASETERELLRSKVQKLMQTDEKGGFIIRTMAEDASDVDLEMDVAYLRKTWSTIMQQAKTQPAPSLLYQDLNLAQRVLRDFVCDETASIQIDSRENFQKLKEFGAIYTPSVLSKFVHYTGERPLFDLYGVEEEIQRALGRRVDLKSGGYLIVDQTEALTTIDVNTGSFVTGRNFDDTIFKTNLEAAQAIARQLRLRNLGGIIILDFIDMARQENRDKVMAELKEALKADRSPTNVSLLSELGLVEMTRKRVRQGLNQALSQTCAACGGLGWVRSTASIAHQALREVEWRMSRKLLPRVKIRAAPDLIDWMKAEEAEIIERLQQGLGGDIELLPEDTFPPGKYSLLEG